MHATSGQILAGRYRVHALLGKGGMGAVYEVEDAATGRILAMKILDEGLGKVYEVARRFEREAKATMLLEHPRILKVLDFGQLDGGGLFLVMELLRGRTLGDLIDSGTLQAERGLAIMRQVLEALEHAHAVGIVHRDLKPTNVMLVADEGPGDVVKLFDFGIAKLVGPAETAFGGEQLTRPFVAFGSPDYMAPEQATGEAVDHRADLYAAGIMIFEILAARRPFQADDPTAVLRKQVLVRPPRLAQVAPDRTFSPEMEDLVAKALAKRPDQRFASATEMIGALDRTMAEPRPARRPVSRRRMVRGAVIGVVVVAALAVLELSTGGRATEEPDAGEPDVVRLIFALEHGATCAKRREAVSSLLVLGDPGAVPALRRAAADASNGCLEAEALEAAHHLRDAPSSAR